MSKNNDVMTERPEPKLYDKYAERHRRFNEVMELIYGERAKDIPAKELISRHRDVAEAILGTKKRSFDPFVDKIPSRSRN